VSDPNQPWGQQPENPYGQPQQPIDPYGQQPAYGAPYPQTTRDHDKRPGTVTAAGITTIVLAGLSFLLYAVVALLTVVARDDMIDAIEDELTADQRDQLGADQLATVLTVIVVVFAVWCLIAVFLGIFAMRRSNVARILLVISAVMTALISLLGITSGVSVVTLAGAVAVIVLLFTGGANDWFSRRRQQPELPQGTSQPWG
jgi:presenilin-like A22 family membrane protease